MDKTYKNFNDLIKHCKYVNEYKNDIFGQGLCWTYEVLCIGTGENIYTLNFLDDKGKKHTFKTMDAFILEWSIRTHPEEGNGEEYYNFELKAYGQYDNGDYGYLYSMDSDDCTLFRFWDLEDVWKLQNIIFQLTDASLNPKTIVNSNDYNEIIRRKDIQNNIDEFQKTIESDSSSDDSDTSSLD